MNNIPRFRLVCSVLILSLVGALGVMLAMAAVVSASAQNPNEELQRALAPVQFGTDAAVAEAECEKLIQRYTNSPETMGRIYLALSLNNAYRVDNNLAKIIGYSRKALQFPLGVIEACDARNNLGGALQMQIRSDGPREREETAMRKGTLVIYLEGLKQVLSQATTLQKQELPGVGIFTYAGNGSNDPMYLQLVQKHADEMKAREVAVAANNLVDRYNWFKEDVVGLYRGIPYTEEITEEGEKIMPGEPVLKELVGQVNEFNAPRALGGPDSANTAQVSFLLRNPFGPGQMAASGPEARFDAPEYEVEGVIQEHIIQPGQPDWTTTARFTVYARGRAWLIETSETNSSGGKRRRSVGSSNGAEISQNAYAAATNRNVVSLRSAQVLPNGLPLGRVNDSIIAHLWVVFASHGYFNTQSGTNRLLPVYDVDSELVDRVDLRMEAEWELMSGTNPLPLKVAYRNTGGFYTMNANKELIRLNHPVPYQGGFTDALYTVTAMTNFDGVAFPAGFTFVEFQPGMGRSHYDLRARKKAEAVVTAFRPTCSRNDLGR